MGQSEKLDTLKYNLACNSAFWGVIDLKVTVLTYYKILTMQWLELPIFCMEYVSSIRKTAATGITCTLSISDVPMFWLTGVPLSQKEIYTYRTGTSKCFVHTDEDFALVIT